MSTPITPSRDNMPMRQLSDVICDVVFSATFINRQDLQPRIYALIKACLQKENAPKNVNKPISASKSERYIKTIYRKDLEIKGYREELKKHLSDEQMRAFYDQQNNILKEHGVYSIQ